METISRFAMLAQLGFAVSFLSLMENIAKQFCIV